MLLLAVRDLRHRWLRLAITAATVSVVFAVVFVLVGIDDGVADEPARTIDELGGAAAFVVAEDSLGFLASTSIVPEGVLKQLRSSGSNAWGLVVTRSTIDDTDVTIVGMDPAGTARLRLVAGAPPAADDEVVVSSTQGARIGDTLSLAGRDFRVVGQTGEVTLFAGLPVVFITTTAGQQLGYSGQRILNAVALETPPSTTPAGTRARTPDEIAADAARPIAKASATLRGLAVLMYLIGSAVIGAVVYLSALERRRDFAVLKAVGVPTRILAGGLVLQSLAVTAIGLALAVVLQAGLGPLFPLPVMVPALAYVVVPAVAVVAALLASIGGIVQAVRVEPALAFSSAGQ